jgi:ABC-type multidrug transport system fused ATPase/permease subunit
MARDPLTKRRSTRRRTETAPVVRAAAQAATHPGTATALAPPAPTIIEFRAVSKLYGPGDIGLDEATFSIRRGEFVFLVGSTGSGKTRSCVC